MKIQNKKSEEKTYVCPNCYAPVYKGQINCTECGLQLRKGVGEPKSLSQCLLSWIKIFSVIIGIVIIVLIIYSFL